MHLRDTLLLPLQPAGWADGFGLWKTALQPGALALGSIHPWRRRHARRRWVPGSRAGRLASNADSAAAVRRRRAGGW